MKGSYSVENIGYRLSMRESSQKTFFQKNKKFNFKKVELARLQEIQTAASSWDDTTFFDDNIDRELKLLYQLIHHKTQFELRDTNEKLLFYMFVIDGDFKLLHILMEESDMNTIKNRCAAEGVIYTYELFQLEQYYNKIFHVVEDPFVEKQPKKIIVKEK